MKSCKELHREKFQEMLEWWSLENLCTVMLCDSAFPNDEAPRKVKLSDTNAFRPKTVQIFSILRHIYHNCQKVERVGMDEERINMQVFLHK